MIRGAARVAAYLLTALALLVSASLFWGYAGQGATHVAGPRVGSPAPDFRLRGLGGETVERRSLGDRPLVLYFFATWCPSCQFDLQLLDAKAREHDERSLGVVLVNLRESETHVRAFAEGWGLTLPVALDRDGAVARRYEVTTLPTTFFVTREGILRSTHRGPLASADLEAALALILPNERK